MGSETHPADMLCGLPWRSADLVCTEAYEDEDGFVYDVGDSLLVIECDELARLVLGVVGSTDLLNYVHAEDLHRWALRLDDPLGLGLAGLAARVYQRLTPSCASGPRSLNDAVARAMLSGVPRLWAPNQAHLRAALLAVASYIALSDRLCAAVGLTLEPGEVAEWESWPEADGWTLTADSGLWFFAPVDLRDGNTHHVVVPDLPTDPLTALRAALAALETT